MTSKTPLPVKMTLRDLRHLLFLSHEHLRGRLDIIGPTPEGISPPIWAWEDDKDMGSNNAEDPKDPEYVPSESPMESEDDLRETESGEIPEFKNGTGRQTCNPSPSSFSDAPEGL